MNSSRASLALSYLRDPKFLAALDTAKQMIAATGLESGFSVWQVPSRGLVVNSPVLGEKASIAMHFKGLKEYREGEGFFAYGDGAQEVINVHFHPSNLRPGFERDRLHFTTRESVVFPSANDLFVTVEGAAVNKGVAIQENSNCWVNPINIVGHELEDVYAVYQHDPLIHEGDVSTQIWETFAARLERHLVKVYSECVYRKVPKSLTNPGFIHMMLRISGFANLLSRGSQPFNLAANKRLLEMSGVVIKFVDRESFSTEAPPWDIFPEIPLHSYPCDDDDDDEWDEEDEEKVLELLEELHGKKGCSTL